MHERLIKPAPPLSFMLFIFSRNGELISYGGGLYNTGKDCQDETSHMMDLIDVPDNLYDKALQQFDNLKSRGLLFYEHSVPEYVEDNGFKVGVYSCQIYQVLSLHTC